MNTLGDVARFVKAGHADERTRRALFLASYLGLLLAPLMLAFAVFLVRAQYLAPNPWTQNHVLMWVFWVLAAGTLIRVISQCRSFTIAEAGRLADEKALCRKCFYPRDAELNTCPECGLAHTRP